MARMRTIDDAHALLVAEDADCALTKTALRRLVVTGAIPSVRIGSKYLLDVDMLSQFLSGASTTNEKQPESHLGIRRLEAIV